MLIRRHLNIDLTDAQANSLWDECRVKLQQARLFRAISAAQMSYYGSVDRFAGAEISQVLWKILADMEWPQAADGEEKARIFDKRIQSSVSQRGYIKAETPIDFWTHHDADDGAKQTAVGMITAYADQIIANNLAPAGAE